MDALAESLNESLLRVARQLRRQTQRRIAPLGLNPHQSLALRAIHQLEPVRPSELAQHLGIAARSVTDTVTCLVGSGFVQRQADLSDGRAHLLVLSDSGRAAVKEVLAVRNQVATEHFGRLSDTRQAALADLLSELECSLSEARPARRRSGAKGGSDEPNRA